MKKVFFWLSYLLFLIFFDIILAIIRFNNNIYNSIYEFFINLNIKNPNMQKNIITFITIITNGGINKLFLLTLIFEIK